MPILAPLQSAPCEAQQFFCPVAAAPAGRLASLQRKLADVASFHFLDAPHPLPPFLLRPLPEDSPGRLSAENDPFLLGFAPPEPWVCPERHGQGQRRWAPRLAWVVAPSDREWGRRFRERLKRQEKGGTAGGGGVSSPAAAAKASVPSHAGAAAASGYRSSEGGGGVGSVSAEKGGAAAGPAGSGERGSEREWERPTPDGTYRGQTDGWAESLSLILSALQSADPPFEGLLGFSQGAGAAAAAAAEALRLQAEERRGQGSGGERGGAGGWAPRFVWVCSGYPLAAAATTGGGGSDSGGAEAPAASPSFSAAEAASGRLIDLPSLHVFGGGGGDRGANDESTAAAAAGGDWQVGGAQSEALLRLFPAVSADVVRHEGGHVVPAGDEAVGRYREFLKRFQGEEERRHRES